jgi:hypothetical protein
MHPAPDHLPSTSDSAPPQPGAPAPRRWGGRRTLLILAAISIGWKVLLLGVGGTMTKLLVDDGIAAIPPELRPYGTEAIAAARTLWANPFERLSVRGVRVLSVERLADARTAPCGLGAHVRAYTFFAIPYSEARTVCDRGTVEYRVLRRRTRAN